MKHEGRSRSGDGGVRSLVGETVSELCLQREKEKGKSAKTIEGMNRYGRFGRGPQRGPPEPNSSPTPNPNAIWGDLCFDAVACGGSRLAPKAWMLCFEILQVDSAGPGC